MGFAQRNEPCRCRVVGWLRPPGSASEPAGPRGPTAGAPALSGIGIRPSHGLCPHSFLRSGVGMPSLPLCGAVLLQSTDPGPRAIALSHGPLSALVEEDNAERRRRRSDAGASERVPAGRRDGVGPRSRAYEFQNPPSGPPQAAMAPFWPARLYGIVILDYCLRRNRFGRRTDSIATRYPGACEPAAWLISISHLLSPVVESQ